MQPAQPAHKLLGGADFVLAMLPAYSYYVGLTYVVALRRRLLVACLAAAPLWGLPYIWELLDDVMRPWKPSSTTWLVRN